MMYLLHTLTPASGSGQPRRLAVVVVAAVMLLATPALAQQPDSDGITADIQQDDPPQQPDQQQSDEQSDDDDSTTHPADPGPPISVLDYDTEISDAVQRQLESGQQAIPIYQIAEEMIDEVIADVAKLNPEPLAPVALRQMNLTPNLSHQFGDIVESNLLTALANHTDVTVKRCVACSATRSRVDGDDWVITRGLVEQDDLAREADRLGVKTFMDSRFAFYPRANVVAMQVEFFRADDGAILWSETYRSDDTTAAILRTGDRVESRAERVEELERRIDERPYYGYQVRAGFGYIPYDSPQGGLGGMTGGVLLYEKFGSQREYMYGIGGDGFANFSEGNEIMGGFIFGTLQMDILERDLHSPRIRTGPAIGGFVAGTEGNSMVFEWGLDAIFQYRLGAGASLFYFVPTEFDGHDLGGFGLKGRVSFNW